jgi:transposase InsO family protein
MNAMDEKTRDELALFRFSLIAPLVNGSVTGSLKNYVEGVCARAYQIPGRGLRELSPPTIGKWLSDYRRFGIEGLKRKQRSDRGQNRAITAGMRESIRELKQLHPHKTATTIYQDLLARGALGDPPASLSTISRYARKLETGTSSGDGMERKRFTFEFANDCWQTDTMVGPYLVLDGRKKRTYLLAFLDDASRFLVAGEFFFEENSLNLQTVLKKAILKRGLARRIFADNGKVYNSLSLRMTLATLGVVLSHARVYSPASKGKIERMFRTVRMQFIESLDTSEIHSLEELNQQFTAYAEGTYNLRPHASLNGLSPLERYLQDKERLKFVSSPDKINQVFLHETLRKVKKDATIALLNRVYEVPQGLIGQSVTVRYDPEDLTKMLVKTEGGLVTVYPVRPVDNSRIIRKQNRRAAIDYAALYGGGEPK